VYSVCTYTCRQHDGMELTVESMGRFPPGSQTARVSIVIYADSDSHTDQPEIGGDKLYHEVPAKLSWAPYLSLDLPWKRPSSTDSSPSLTSISQQAPRKQCTSWTGTRTPVPSSLRTRKSSRRGMTPSPQRLVKYVRDGRHGLSPAASQATLRTLQVLEKYFEQQWLLPWMQGGLSPHNYVNKSSLGLPPSYIQKTVHVKTSPSE
jgi:hypothetical protein